MAKTIREHHLLNDGDRVLIGLSGGPDSVALTHVLASLRPELHLTLLAVYINHLIRPADILQREEEFCATLCRHLDLEFNIVRGDIPERAQSSGKGIEATAREFRYATFHRLAEEHYCTRIAVGHHADDQAETVLFRVLRGTGRLGLIGIPIRRGRIIRPLLHVTREEVLAYLEQHRLGWCEDATNQDESYQRNYLRTTLLPLIRENINPRIRRALTDLADTMDEENAFLETIVLRARELVVNQTVGGKFELDLDRFLSYDKWIRRRLLRYCLAELSSDRSMPDKEVVDRVDRVAYEQANAELSLPERIRAVRLTERLVVWRDESAAYDVDLPIGGRVELPALRLEFAARLLRPPLGSPLGERRARSVHVDYERVVPPLEVRNIRPGDRFRPLGLDGSKKVGNYLTDRKVVRIYRDEIPVVCDQQGIIWLVGYEIDDRVKIADSTRKVLTIECRERDSHKAEAV